MKKLSVILVIAVTMLMSGCSSFQKERDLEMYIVGGVLSYVIGKHACRQSEFDEICGVGAAAAFVLWY
ncbi:MAG: hypothetical protein ACJAWS_001887 [Oleiphilaceae bacterium]|jgi:hypothetical protein